MATKRKTTRLRGGDVLAVEEYHDGRYGAPGMPRQKKEKPTKEDMQKVNAMNKARRCHVPSDPVLHQRRLLRHPDL